MHSVVVIKRGLVVEADKNFSSQLRLMNLSDGSPYETLHAFVSNAVAPYFKSYVRATGKADRLAFVYLIWRLQMGLCYWIKTVYIKSLHCAWMMFSSVMHGYKGNMDLGCNVTM